MAQFVLECFCKITVRVMADTQPPVEVAVPAAQALVQVRPVAAVNVENPQQNPAPLQV